MKKGQGKAVVRGGEVIDVYRRLEARTSRMATLADQQDWESLVSQQEDYVTAMAALAELEQEAELSEAQCAEKSRMLGCIMAHNRKTQSCLMQRRDELARLMATARCERDLDRAYGAQAGIAVRRPPGGRKSES